MVERRQMYPVSTWCSVVLSRLIKVDEHEVSTYAQTPSTTAVRRVRRITGYV